MKKNLILIMTVIFSLTFSACSAVTDSEISQSSINNEQSDISIEQQFNEIMSELSDPTSAHLKINSESKMILADSSVISNDEHEIKYDMREQGNIKYHSISNSSSSALEGNIIAETYYLDGYFYTKYGNTKIKYESPEQEAFQAVDYSSLTFKAEELLNFSFEENEQHNTFKYSIKENSLSQHIEQLEEIYGATDEIEFITASGEAIISKEGNLLKTNMQIELKINAPSLSATIITNTNTEYYSINENIEIIYPEDLQSYIEY